MGHILPAHLHGRPEAEWSRPYRDPADNAHLREGLRKAGVTV
ncbi:hypothetical protein [Ensifer sp. BR816]|nr:hypothetical protein [Ensifer sp. BR816]